MNQEAERLRIAEMMHEETMEDLNGLDQIADEDIPETEFFVVLEEGPYFRVVVY